MDIPLARVNVALYTTRLTPCVKNNFENFLLHGSLLQKKIDHRIIQTIGNCIVET
jgi:hypothetical protein